MPDREFWKDQLAPFIERHPTLYPEAGEIFVPKRYTYLTLFFEGAFHIDIKGDEGWEINFNHDAFLIVAWRGTVDRVLWEKLAGFRIHLFTPVVPERERESFGHLH